MQPNSIPTKIKITGGTVTINFLSNPELSNSGELDSKQVTNEKSTLARAKETSQAVQKPEKPIAKRQLSAAERLEAQRAHIEAKKATKDIFNRLTNSCNTTLRGYNATNQELYSQVESGATYAAQAQKDELAGLKSSIITCQNHIIKYGSFYKTAYKASFTNDKDLLGKICKKLEIQYNTLLNLTGQFNSVLVQILEANDNLEELINGFEKSIINGDFNATDYISASVALSSQKLKNMGDSQVEDEYNALALEEQPDSQDHPLEAVTQEALQAADQLNNFGDALAQPLDQRPRRQRAQMPLPATPPAANLSNSTIYDWTVGPVLDWTVYPVANGLSYMIYGSTNK